MCVCVREREREREREKEKETVCVAHSYVRTCVNLSVMCKNVNNVYLSVHYACSVSGVSFHECDNEQWILECNIYYSSVVFVQHCFIR